MISNSNQDMHRASVGGFFGLLLWFVVSLGLIVCPFLLPSLIPSFKIGSVAQLICMTVGLISLIMMSVVVVVTKLYQKAGANKALVRTGMGGIKIVKDAGILFIPVLHRMLAVSLETMRLDVDRRDKDALLTADNLRANLLAQFYIKVQSNEEDITSAARSLGDRSMDAKSISDLVFDKLVSALRAVAAKSTLFDLNSEREKFASDVKAAVSADLKHNGLTLESVTISGLDQTSISILDESNVFDAQGRKRITQITSAARVERNTMERDAEQKIATQDVSTKKAVLTLDLDRQRAEAEQQRDVANARSEAGRKAAEFKLEQDQAVAQREVEKNRAVKAAEIDAQKKLVLSAQDRELAEVGKTRAVETAGVEKVRAVEVATRDQQIAIAGKEAERATAEAARLLAESDREKAAQQVKTVETVQTAERDMQKGVIEAKAEAERKYVESQRNADAEAYRLRALADGKKAAAEAEAYAKIKAAEAAQTAAEKQAAADKAVQTVPVEIAAKQVEVEKSRQMIAVDVATKQVEVKRQQVVVDRQELEQREQFGHAALDFELSKLRIAKEAEIRIASATAFGTIMSKAEMNIFGDPETVSKMTERFMGALSLGKGMDGFFNGLGDGKAKELVESAAAAAVAALEGTGEALKGMGKKRGSEV